MSDDNPIGPPNRFVVDPELASRGALPIMPSPFSDPFSDPINHPDHYTGHPSGVECIQITEHMGFNLGNAVKYIWRADSKGDAKSDLEKAEWYIDRELKRRGFR